MLYVSSFGGYHNMKKPKPRRKAVKPYTRGELNKLIDTLCHPLFQENPGFILIDGLLHGLVEPLEYKPKPKGDPHGGYAETTQMKKLLQWEPKVQLKDGIKTYYNWINQNKNIIPQWL